MSGVENLCQQLASTTVNSKGLEQTALKQEKEVSFAGRKLKLDTENDAEEVVKAINLCDGMTTLRLDGNTIGIPAAKAIGKALEKQPYFTKALWKDMFTQRTVDEIPKALQHLSDSIILANAQLVHLDLSDNAFGPRGLLGLVKLLESSSCYTLQELHLNNNGLGISGAKMLAESLCKSVENSQRDGNPLSLKIFVCGRNRLENEGAIAVSRFFKMLGTLQSVAMPQNGIYAPGIENLAEAFKSNPNLQVINLEDNTLTEEGAKFIANCLPHLKYINMLNFGDCLIKTKGAIVLAEALSVSCPELREFYLGYNEIRFEGGKAIVEAMENKEMLDMLVLNGNLLGEDGCSAIQRQMEDYGLADKLGTLSEDEGDDNEDDEEDYENGEQGSDSANEDDHNKSVIIENVKHTSPMQKISPSEFYAFPTPSGLIFLHGAKENLLSALPENPSVSEYLDLFAKICSVVQPENNDTKMAACDFVDDILTNALKLSVEVSEFTNQFLVSLRLLKCEGKKFSSKVDVTGAFSVLQHVVKQPYFPKSTRDVLQFFISQPLLFATASEKTQHGLLQILYQI